MGHIPVILGTSAGGSDDTSGGGSAPVSAGTTILASEHALSMIRSFRGGTRNLPVLAAAAAGVGHLHVMPEVDGVVRRIPAVVVAADRLVPALAFEAARVRSEEHTPELQSLMRISYAGFSLKNKTRITNI